MVVIVLVIIAGYFFFALVVSSLTVPRPATAIAVALIDPALFLLVAYGYWRLKKWSVILFGSYVALAFILLLLTRPQGLPVSRAASILILASMAGQWRKGSSRTCPARASL